jgi:hypothetical protein
VAIGAAADLAITNRVLSYLHVSYFIHRFTDKPNYVIGRIKAGM